MLRLFKETYEEGLQKMTHKRAYKFIGKIFAFLFITTLGFFSFLMFSTTSVFASGEYQTESDNIGQLDSFFSYQEINGANYLMEGGEGLSEKAGRRILSLDYNDCIDEPEYSRKLDTTNSLQAFDLYFWNSESLWETLTLNGQNKQLAYTNVSENEEVNDGSKYSLSHTGTTYSPYTLFVKKPNWREATYKYVDFAEGTSQEDALQTSYADSRKEAFDNYDYPTDVANRGDSRYNNSEYKSVLSGDSAKSNNGKYYNATKISSFYTTYENTTTNKGSDNSNNASVGDDYIYDNAPSNTYNYIYDNKLISNITLYAYQHPTDSYVLTDYQGKKNGESGFKTYPYYDTNSKQLCVWNGTSFTVYDTSGAGYYNESDFTLEDVANENGNVVFFNADKIVKYYKLWNALATESGIYFQNSSSTYNKLENSISQADYDTLVDTASSNPQVDGDNKYTTYSKGNIIGYLANYSYNWTYVNDKVFDYTNTYKQQQYSFQAIPQSYTDTYTKNKSTVSSDTLLSTLNSKTNVSSYNATNTNETYYEYNADNWDSIKTNIFKSNNYTFTPQGTYTITYGSDRLSQGSPKTAYYNGTSYNLYKSGNSFYYNPVTTNYGKTKTKTASAVYKWVDDTSKPIYSYDYSKPIAWEQVFDGYEQKQVLDYYDKKTQYKYKTRTMSISAISDTLTNDNSPYSTSIKWNQTGVSSTGYVDSNKGDYSTIVIDSVTQHQRGDTHNHSDSDKPNKSNSGNNDTNFKYLLQSDINNKTDGTNGYYASGNKLIYSSDMSSWGTNSSKWKPYVETAGSAYYYHCTGFSDSCGWFGNQYDFNWERVYISSSKQYHYGVIKYSYYIFDGSETDWTDEVRATGTLSSTVRLDGRTDQSNTTKYLTYVTQTRQVNDTSKPHYKWVDDTSKPIYKNGNATDWATYISGYEQKQVVDYYELSYGNYYNTSNSEFSVTFYGFASGVKPNNNYIHSTREVVNARTKATALYYWYDGISSYTKYENVSVNNSGTVLINANNKMSKTDVTNTLSQAGETTATINNYINGCDKYIKGYNYYTNTKTAGSWSNVNGGTADNRKTTSKVESYYSSTTEGKPTTSGNTTTITFTRTYYRYDGLTDTSTNATKTFTSGAYNTSGNYNAFGETSPLNNKANGNAVYRFISTSQPSLNSTDTVDTQTSTYSIRQSSQTDYSKTSSNSAYYGNQKPAKYPTKSINDSVSANDVLHTPTTSVTFTPLYAYTKTITTYTYKPFVSSYQINYGDSKSTTTVNDYKKSYQDSVLYTASGLKLNGAPTSKVEVNTMTNVNKVDQNASFINSSAKKYFSNDYFYVNGDLNLNITNHNGKTGNTISFTTTDISKVSVYLNNSTSKSNLTSLGSGRYSYTVNGGRITTAKLSTTGFTGIKDIMIAENNTTYVPYVSITNEYSVNTTKYYGYKGTKSYNYDYYNAMYSKEMQVEPINVEKVFDFNINDYVYKATSDNAKITFTYPDKLSWQYKIDDKATENKTNTATLTINLLKGQKVNVKACLNTYASRVFVGDTEFRDSVSVNASIQNATVNKEVKTPNGNEKIVEVAKLSRDIWYKRIRKDNLVYANSTLMISNDDNTYKYALQGVTTKDSIPFDEANLKSYIKLSDGKYYPMNNPDTLYQYLYEQNQYIVRYYYNNSFWTSPDSREYKRKLTLYTLNTAYGISGYTVINGSDSELLSKEIADKITTAISTKYGKNSYLVDINKVNSDLENKATTETTFKDSSNNSQTIRAFLPYEQNGAEKYILYMNNYLYSGESGNNNVNFLIYIDDSLVKEGLSDVDAEQYYYLSVDIDGKCYMLRSNFRSEEYSNIDNGPKIFSEVYTSTMKGSWEKAENTSSYFTVSGTTNVENLVKAKPTNSFENINVNFGESGYYKDTTNGKIYVKTSAKDGTGAPLSENTIYNYFAKNAKTNKYSNGKNYNTLIVTNDNTQGIYKLYEKVNMNGEFVYFDNEDIENAETQISSDNLSSSRNVYQIKHIAQNTVNKDSSKTITSKVDTLSDFILYSKYEDAKKSSFASQNLYVFDRISKDNVSFGTNEIIDYVNWANVKASERKFSQNKDNEFYKLLKYLTEVGQKYVFNYDEEFPVGRNVHGQTSGLEGLKITDDIFDAENIIYLTYNFATTDFCGVMMIEKQGTASNDINRTYYVSPTVSSNKITPNNPVGQQTVRCLWTVNDLLSHINLYSDSCYKDYNSLYEALLKKGAMNDVFWIVNRMTEERMKGNNIEADRLSSLLLRNDTGSTAEEAKQVAGALGLRTSALQDEGVIGLNIVSVTDMATFPSDAGCDDYNNRRDKADYKELGITVFTEPFVTVKHSGQEIEAKENTFVPYDNYYNYSREINAYNLGLLRDKYQYYTIDFGDGKGRDQMFDGSFTDPSNYFQAFTSNLNDYNSKSPYILLNQYLQTGCMSGEGTSYEPETYGFASRPDFIGKINNVFINRSSEANSIIVNGQKVPKTLYLSGVTGTFSNFTFQNLYDFLPEYSDYSENIYKKLADVIFKDYKYETSDGDELDGFDAYDAFCSDYGITNLVNDAQNKFDEYSEKSNCCKYFTDTILYNKIYYDTLIAYLKANNTKSEISNVTRNSQLIKLISDNEGLLWTNKFSMVFPEEASKAKDEDDKVAKISNRLQKMLENSSLVNKSKATVNYKQITMDPKTIESSFSYAGAFWLPNEHFERKDIKIDIASKYYLVATQNNQVSRYINFREKEAGKSVKAFVRKKHQTNYGNIYLFADENCSKEINMKNGFVVYFDDITGEMTLYYYPEKLISAKISDFNNYDYAQPLSKVYYFEIYASEDLGKQFDAKLIENAVNNGTVRSMTIAELLKYFNYDGMMISNRGTYHPYEEYFKEEVFELEGGNIDEMNKLTVSKENIESLKSTLSIYGTYTGTTTVTRPQDATTEPINYGGSEFYQQLLKVGNRITTYNHLKYSLLETIERMYETTNEFITIREGSQYFTYKKIKDINATKLLFKDFKDYRTIYDILVETFNKNTSATSIEIETPDYLEHQDDYEVSSWYNVNFVGQMTTDGSKIQISEREYNTFINEMDDTQNLFYVACPVNHEHESTDYGDSSSISGYLIPREKYNSFKKLIKDAILLCATPEELKTLNPDCEETIRSKFIELITTNKDNVSKIDDYTVYLKDINSNVIGSKYSMSFSQKALWNSLAEIKNKAKILFSLRYKLEDGESPKNGFVVKDGWAYYQWPDELMFKANVEGLKYFNALDEIPFNREASQEQMFDDLPSGKTIYIILGVEELSGATTYTQTIKLETEEDMVRNPYNPTGINNLSDKEDDILNIGNITYKDFKTMFMLNETGYNIVKSTAWANNIRANENNSFESTTKVNRDITSEKCYRFYKTTLPKMEIKDIAFRFDIGYYQDGKWIDIDSSATNYQYSNSIKICNKDKTITTYYDRSGLGLINGSTIGYNTSNLSSDNSKKKYYSLEQNESLKKAFYNGCNGDIQKFLEYILSNYILDVSEATYNKLKDKNVRVRMEFWYYDSFIYTDFNRNDSFTADTGKIGGTEVYVSSGYQETTKEERIFGNKSVIDTTNTTKVISSLTGFQKAYDQNVNHKLGAINEKDYRAIELKNVDSKARYILLLVNDDGSGWIVS